MNSSMVPVSLAGSAPSSVELASSLKDRLLQAALLERVLQAAEGHAASLPGLSGQQELLNDFLAAGREYRSALARESRHCPRYAAWCLERAAELAQSLGGPEEVPEGELGQGLRIFTRHLGGVLQKGNYSKCG
ncbi:hypothetical protein [Roseibacillus ishigakijimensis]|uniref:Uncharacterized protein n=1 Tax=Roseibacillus ishigakijimensis TaxID=454146 RepID=A0A934RPS1_9BACT|nr:hypothetical protein [Roseibacillus ishigakijimensis]MBK1835244.1 hypothetical protein [Roseibacillus ishigakijimensis]